MRKTKYISASASGLVLVIASIIGYAWTQVAYAACSSALPSGRGTAAFTINVPTSGKYRLWTHMLAPTTSNNAVYVRVDDTHCQLTVGDSAQVAANQFSWIDYQGGNTSNKIDVTLSAGNHTFTYAGLDEGVGIDKMLLVLDGSCNPSGDGSNCGAVVASPVVSNNAQTQSHQQGSNTGDANQSQGAATDNNEQAVAMQSSGVKPFKRSFILLPLAIIFLIIGVVYAIWTWRPDVFRKVRSVLQSVIRTRSFRVSPGGEAPASAVVVGNMRAIPRYKWWGLAGAAGFGLVGLVMMVFAFAASSAIAFMIPGAQLSNGATVVSHGSAISGKMVKFASPAAAQPSASTPTTPPTQPTPPPPAQPSEQSCPAYPAFPDANCTGVPAGITLSNYTGPCTITAANTVIDSKTVNCWPLYIHTANVTIKNSRINGSVSTSGESNNYSFTITDSEVITPMATAWTDNFTSIGSHNFTVLRVEASGGNRSVNCARNCTVQDSWVHGQKVVESPEIHASGVRQGQGSKIIHNRLNCEAMTTSTGGGCSGDLTGYGDFEPVRDNRVEKNLFMATLAAGTCAYGGSSGNDGSKPYGNQAANIVFVDNIFQRGSNRKCAIYVPILDFDTSRPGNQWINNRWDDGGIVPPG